MPVPQPLRTTLPCLLCGCAFCLCLSQSTRSLRLTQVMLTLAHQSVSQLSNSLAVSSCWTLGNIYFFVCMCKFLCVCVCHRHVCVYIHTRNLEINFGSCSSGDFHVGFVSFRGGVSSLIGLELTGSVRLTDHQAPDMLEGRLEQWLALQCCRSPWEVIFCCTIQGQSFGRGIPEPPADPEPQAGRCRLSGKRVQECLGS